MFYRGFRNKHTGAVYHHAETQTPTERSGASKRKGNENELIYTVHSWYAVVVTL
jgi:hypothetical protein